MILATCDSGSGGARGGSQMYGLAASLLTMGARTVVAAIGVLPDSPETRTMMIALHRDLARGVRASASLAHQRAADDGGSSLVAAGLVTLGTG
jgi:CHAT domain-containing protein